MDWEAVAAVIDRMSAEGLAALTDAGIEADAARFTFAADMRYFGQQNEVTVDLPDKSGGLRDTVVLRERFEAAYEGLYGIRLPEMDVEVVSWRVSAIGPPVARHIRIPAATIPATPKRRREVRFADGARRVDVYDRTALADGQILDGPAIIEERETTIVVLPGWQARVDADGCIIATREGGKGY